MNNMNNMNSKVKFMKTERDGNCLFNAIECYLEYERSKTKLSKKEQKKRAYKLREDTINYMKELKEEKDELISLLLDQEVEERKYEDWVEYLLDMVDDGEWGGQTEIVVISRMLKRSIEVYKQVKISGKMRLKKYTGAGYMIENTDAIRLLYRGQHHYDFLI